MLGEDYGAWAEGRIWRFYLRNGMEWKNLAFRLPGDSDAAAVERIELQKWKFLSLGKVGARLEKAESGNNEYRYPKPRFEQIGFASKTIGTGLLGVEFLLFAIAWIFARRHREEHWRILLPSVLGVSLALTLLMQVTLPIQSYIANQSSFPFTLPALCGAVAMRFVLLFAWNTLAIFLLTRLSIFGGKSGEFPKISFKGLHYIAICEVQTEEENPFGAGWVESVRSSWSRTFFIRPQ